MDMMKMTATSAGNNNNSMTDDEKKRAVCHLLGIHEGDIETIKKLGQLLEAYQNKCAALEQKCNTLETQCTALTKQCHDATYYASLMCCPGNILYSLPTTDSYSDDERIEFLEVVKGLGDPYVDSFPVPPGKKILLTHKKRPGFCPGIIAADFGLANNGNNYLDLALQWYVSADDTEPLTEGQKIGSRFSGNDFLDKDGRQKDRNFPQWRNRVICVGGLERLFVELSHLGGANSIDSAQIRLFHANNAWYEACAEEGQCKPLKVAPKLPPPV